MNTEAHATYICLDKFDKVDVLSFRKLNYTQVSFKMDTDNLPEGQLLF